MLRILIAVLLALFPLVVSAEPARFSVTVTGSGPDVILVPGLMSDRAVWDGSAAALEGHRVHLVQIAGFAGEPAGSNGQGPLLAPIVEELGAYIASVGLERPRIVGHFLAE
jgi:pimeloyl-ACP methyl ester carboxylesterase